ncbi:hypothetical protein J25TS5_04330 [Paenibacillus faecis]|uniref:hypothetical protein n=1 Tax=Paenibacillus faecis TaxID=862114 RepID=UPI001B20784C|nr:hypothetical protein [Paenibacillus faecis]GIO83501.1 hypothetical protein J25TS5_04330 [Paenibacillus faecis]
MKEDAKQKLWEIQKIYETQLANGNRTIQLNVPSFEFLLEQLAEKDATIEKLWETLQWTLSALTRMSASEPVFNLDEVIKHATRVLQESEHGNE